MLKDLIGLEIKLAVLDYRVVLRNYIPATALISSIIRIASASAAA